MFHVEMPSAWKPSLVAIMCFQQFGNQKKMAYYVLCYKSILYVMSSDFDPAWINPKVRLANRGWWWMLGQAEMLPGEERIQPIFSSFCSLISLFLFQEWVHSFIFRHPKKNNFTYDCTRKLLFMCGQSDSTSCPVNCLVRACIIQCRLDTILFIHYHVHSMTR